MKFRIKSLWILLHEQAIAIEASLFYCIILAMSGFSHIWVLLTLIIGYKNIGCATYFVQNKQLHHEVHFKNSYNLNNLLRSFFIKVYSPFCKL